MIRTNRLTATAQRVSETLNFLLGHCHRLPDHATREIDEQVDQQPGDQQQQNCGSAERNRTRRHFAQRQQLLLIEISRSRFRPIRVGHPPASVPTAREGEYPIGNRRRISTVTMGPFGRVAALLGGSAAMLPVSLIVTRHGAPAPTTRTNG